MIFGKKISTATNCRVGIFKNWQQQNWERRGDQKEKNTSDILLSIQSAEEDSVEKGGR